MLVSGRPGGPSPNFRLFWFILVVFGGEGFRWFPSKSMGHSMILITEEEENNVNDDDDDDGDL